jgi:hypothetical protein
LSRRQPAPLEERLAAHAERDTSTGCLLWTGTLNATTGYGVLKVDGKYVGAHRVAWQLAHPGDTLPHIVRHTCDVRLCIEPAHLLAGDPRSNAADCHDRHRHRYAERHPNARLTDADVAAIRVDPRSSSATAPDYGVHPATIRAIRRGHSRPYAYGEHPAAQ